MGQFFRVLALLVAFTGMIVVTVMTVALYGFAGSGDDTDFLFGGLFGTVFLLVLLDGLFFGLLADWIGSQRERKFVNRFCLGLYFSIFVLIALVATPSLPGDTERA